jgi:hypothetical protein
VLQVLRDGEDARARTARPPRQWLCSLMLPLATRTKLRPAPSMLSAAHTSSLERPQSVGRCEDLQSSAWRYGHSRPVERRRGIDASSQRDAAMKVRPRERDEHFWKDERRWDGKVLLLPSWIELLFEVLQRSATLESPQAPEHGAHQTLSGGLPHARIDRNWYQTEADFHDSKPRRVLDRPREQCFHHSVRFEGGFRYTKPTRPLYEGARRAVPDKGRCDPRAPSRWLS